MKRLELGIISANTEFKTRMETLATAFQFQAECFNNTEDLAEKSDEFEEVLLVVLDCRHVTSASNLIGSTQVAKQIMPDSYIVVVVNSKLLPEEARWLKNSGASLVMMDIEFFNSSKLEFVSSQVIRSSFIPIKPLDLLPGEPLTCAIFYLLPVNQRFLKVLNTGTAADEKFLIKHENSGDLYIRRDQLLAWAQYCQRQHSRKENDLLRQARMRFLLLNQSFQELVLLISDQSTAASFAQGRELFDNCMKFADSLLESLATINEPWALVNGSAIGDFGSIERAPAIASYSGLLSHQSRIGEAREVLLSALLADIGFLELKPSITQKIREDRLANLNAEEKVEYEKHPIYSLNQCLSRKLPLSEATKNMILRSHERIDRQGFPHRPNPEKLSDADFLIPLCWELDSKSQVRLGKERPDIRAVKKEVLESALKVSGAYPLSLLLKMKPLLGGTGAPDFTI